MVRYFNIFISNVQTTCYLFVTKYFTFRGRASRKEYICLTILFCVLDYILSLCLGLLYKDNSLIIEFIFTGVILFFPMISVTVRRLHDFDKSWWWVLWIFILLESLYLYFQNHPIFLEYTEFFIWGMWSFIFVLALIQGTPDSNRYGEPPEKLNMNQGK